MDPTHHEAVEGVITLFGGYLNFHNKVLIIFFLCQSSKSKVNVDLYSAFMQTPLTRSDMDHTV